MFTELLPRLRRAAVRLLGSPFGAEDVVHETYLRIARRPARFLGHPQPYAYAFTAMANVVRDEWRRDRRRLLPHDAPEDVEALGGLAAVRGRGGGAAEPSDGGVAELQAHWEVVRLLRCLTVKQARAVLLVDLDGYSLEEAASLLGVHRSTLAVTRRRALERLRTVLEREREAATGPGPPSAPPAPRCPGATARGASRGASRGGARGGAGDGARGGARGVPFSRGRPGPPTGPDAPI